MSSEASDLSAEVNMRRGVSGAGSDGNMPVQNQPVKNKPRRFSYTVFGVILGVSITVALLYLFGRLTVNKTATVGSEASDTKNETTASSDKDQEIETKTSQKYLYVKDVGGLVLGFFDTKEEVSLTKPLGAFGFVNALSVSPNGKYVLYLRLPEKTIADYTENPPYEFHGSSEWELHLIDISDTKNPKDTKISDNRFYGLGEAEEFYIWEPDSSAVYFTESYPVKTFKIEIAGKKLYEIADSIPAKLTSAGVLTDGGFVKLEKLGSLEQSVLNERYNLNLYDGSGQLDKVLYKDFVAAHGELDIKLINDNKVAVAREVFTDDGIGNSVCYVEILDIPSSEVKEIEKRNCPPDQSFTSYRNLSISPDGKYLVAVYPEKETSSFLVHNLLTGETRTDVAKKNSWYSDYWWVSDTEILGHIPAGRFDSTEEQVFRINVETGSAEKDNLLYGKSVRSVFR